MSGKNELPCIERLGEVWRKTQGVPSEIWIRWKFGVMNYWGVAKERLNNKQKSPVPLKGANVKTYEAVLWSAYSSFKLRPNKSWTAARQGLSS